MITFSLLFLASLLTLSFVILSLRVLKVQNPRARSAILLFSLVIPILLIPLSDWWALKTCVSFLPGSITAIPLLHKEGFLGMLAIGAVAFTLLRTWAILRRQRVFLARCQELDQAKHPRVYETIGRLAFKAGISSPLILTYPRKVNACNIGWWKPRIILSERLLGILDEEELEAVLAHEVAHIARRDNLFKWIILVFGSLFAYFPTSLIIPRWLEEERERLCDDFTISLIGNPLAFADALVKTWRHSDSIVSPSPSTSLFGREYKLEDRIRRIIECQAFARPVRNNPPLFLGALLIAIIAMVGTVEAVNHKLPHGAHSIRVSGGQCCSNSQMGQEAKVLVCQ